MELVKPLPTHFLHVTLFLYFNNIKAEMILLKVMTLPRWYLISNCSSFRDFCVFLHTKGKKENVSR